MTPLTPENPAVPVSRRRFLGTVSAGLVFLAAGPDLLLGDPAAPVPDRGPLFGRVGPLTPRILVLGIGSAGGTILAALTRDCPELRRMALHTDAREVARFDADRMHAIGAQATRGLGCAARPEWGRRAAEESAPEIAHMLGDAAPDLVFLVGGMGGGTFTGAAPVVARLARRYGALTVAVVTRPFEFEGRVRRNQAAAGLRELLAAADTVIGVPNDAAIEIAGSRVRYLDAVRLTALAASAAIRAVVGLLTRPGIVNVGFADIRAVLPAPGPGATGSGSATGADRAAKATRLALASPFLRGADLKRARGVLFQVAGENALLDEVRSVSSILYDRIGDDALVIFGDTPAPDPPGRIAVTVVATGCLPTWPLEPRRSVAPPPAVGPVAGRG